MNACARCGGPTLTEADGEVCCAWCEKAWLEWEFLAAWDAELVLSQWADEVKLASVGGH